MVDEGEIVVGSFLPGALIDCRQILETAVLLRRPLFEEAEQFRCGFRIGPEGRHVGALGVFSDSFTKMFMQGFTQVGR